VIQGVKQAYYALLQAERLVTVAQKTIEQSESHLRQAEAFFRTGTKPRFDVTRAEVELNNSRLESITAKSNLRLGAISLNKAMGVEPGRPVAIEGIRFALVTMPSVSSVEAEAVRSRPEMLKAGAAIEAARAQVSAERSGYLPSISASGSYSWANGTAESGPFRGDIGNSWNTAVMLTLPLYEGRVTTGRVGEALANLRVAEAQRDALRQAILLEVNRAYADFESAGARLDVMDSSLKKARENLDIAQGRYRSGVGPYLEVTDAQVTSIKAETDYVQAQYDYQLAVAKLEMAMGVIRTE
jgi:outer membrane protein TolC